MKTFGTEYGFCAQTATFWQMIGNLLLIVKILVPVVLILLGIITLGKAVISTDEKDMKNGLNSMLKKFIVSVMIFFIPTLVSAMFGLVDAFEELEADYSVCEACVAHPKGNFCKDKVIALETDAK